MLFASILSRIEAKSLYSLWERSLPKAAGAQQDTSNKFQGNSSTNSD